jgi:hypothetical protein
LGSVFGNTLIENLIGTHWEQGKQKQKIPISLPPLSKKKKIGLFMSAYRTFPYTTFNNSLLPPTPKKEKEKENKGCVTLWPCHLHFKVS